MQFENSPKKRLKGKETMQLEQIANQLKILGNPNRLRVFRHLVRVGTKGAPVGSIQNALGLAGSTLTSHLQKLVAVGLAHQERKGTELICTANYDSMQTMIDYLEKECCLDEGSSTTNCKLSKK